MSYSIYTCTNMYWKPSRIYVQSSFSCSFYPLSLSLLHIVSRSVRISAMGYTHNRCASSQFDQRQQSVHRPSVRFVVMPMYMQHIYTPYSDLYLDIYIQHSCSNWGDGCPLLYFGHSNSSTRLPSDIIYIHTHTAWDKGLRYAMPPL